MHIASKQGLSRCLTVLLCVFGIIESEGQNTEVIVTPLEYPSALRNPHKGFTNRGFWEDNEWATLAHSYIRWNEIENDATDGIDKIRQWCDRTWKDVEKENVKIIPRVYLHWSGDRKYWPADMQADDYSSEQFEQRVVRLIERLGISWDQDPRVAHVEMGLIGKWGEHHSPSPSEEIQQLLGDAFTRSFKHKKVMVRHGWEFTDYHFGVYWDSWAHANQQKHADGIAALGDRWQTAIIGGEVAYDWGDFEIQPGDSPTDTVTDPVHRRHLIDTIRQLHCTQLRWVADYDHDDLAARAGGEEVQKAFGYRFVVDEVRFSRRVSPGGEFTVAFAVRNTGSAPFYYDWPVALSLLDPDSRQEQWRATFADTDIRNWLPGDRWNSEEQAYEIPPTTYRVENTFTFPETLEAGAYILALSILDPAGLLPAARFAIENYFAGGRHPIGLIGVDADVEKGELDPAIFDDPGTDGSLHYVYRADMPANTAIASTETAGSPDYPMLAQNYPNPFNNGTTIRFSLSYPDRIDLSIYNLQGQKVATIEQGMRPAGAYSPCWKGTDDRGEELASGIYLYRLRTDSHTETRKLILLQ